MPHAALLTVYDDIATPRLQRGTLCGGALVAIEVDRGTNGLIVATGSVCLRCAADPAARQALPRLMHQHDRSDRYEGEKAVYAMRPKRYTGAIVGMLCGATTSPRTSVKYSCGLQFCLR